MDLRQLRGMELAETRTIRKRDGWWWVPSQTGSKFGRAIDQEVCDLRVSRF